MNVLDIFINAKRIRIDLDQVNAPKTCAYFTDHVEHGLLDSAVIFRVLAESNQQNEQQPLINVVQLGAPQGLDAPRTVIPHEDTRHSGLRHKKWTVSAARYAPGELYGSFFVCMRDEPQLDFGGDRQPDGLGFAAFGRVTEGFELLATLHAAAGSNDLLTRPLPVDSLRLHNIPASEQPEQDNRKKS